MKKTERNGITYLQPETDEDLDYILLTNSLLFFKDEDGNLYCEDYVSNLLVVFIKNKNCWEVCSKEEKEQVKQNKTFDVSFDKTWKEFESKSLLPLQALKEAKEIANKEYEEYWKDKRDHPKRKVIGWTDQEDLPFLPIEPDDNDEHFAALVNDIYDHGYFFAGDEIELIPIFDDYRTLHLSSRSMGQAMALANGDGDSMAYALYAWAGRLYDDYDMDDTVLPNNGPYRKSDVLDLDEPTYKYLKDYVHEFWYTDHSTDDLDSSMLIIPVPLSEKMFWGEKLTIKNKNTGETFETKTHDIRCVYYKEELEEYIDEQLEYLSSDEDKFLFVDNYKLAAEYLKKTPVVLLVFKSL